MKWGTQGFLNDVDSEDSGWYKFSIRSRREGRKKANSKDFGHSITFQIADCSQKIYLDMHWSGLFYSHMNDISRIELGPIDEALSNIRARRKKIKKFAAAVAKAAVKIEESLDIDEAEVLEFRAKVVEAKREKEQP